MHFYFCNNCNKETGHKRALGWGTFFAVILTCGLWLFTIPLYPRRCIICGKAEEIVNIKQLKDSFIGILVIVIIVLLGIGLIYLTSK